MTVTSSTARLVDNAPAIVIRGSGFDPIVAYNSVLFNDGAAGNVTQANATSLTVAFTTAPTAAGNLTAVVTADGGNSGAAVQVANVAPVVTNSTVNLAANAGNITIKGLGFDTTTGNNTVAFNDGAAGNVTQANATSLTVSLSAAPTAGNLTAVVTTDGVDSGATVQVATVTPVVTGSAGNLSASAGNFTISGFGFDATAGNNTVSFSDGAAGNVTLANATSLTVTLSTAPTAGNMTVVVTTDGVNSGTAVQVATARPVVTTSSANLSADTTMLTITGAGFDPTAGNNTVAFNDGAAGNVVAANATSLTVSFSAAPTAGNLTAAVTSDSVSSGNAVLVAKVTPVVTSSADNLAANAGNITINGFGFDATAGNNTVSFNDGAVGNVTAANATSLTVSLANDPAVAGNLTALVATNGANSAATVQVAKVTPVVTSSTGNLAANAGNITIHGFGFDGTAGNNTVVFNDGAAGNVSAANATSLTVTLTTDPTTAGNLTAVVATDGVSSGTALQVATVTPVVTIGTGNLVANAGTLTISGYGFDAAAGNNTVAFNDGAAGNVTAANATSLTVTLSTAPTAAGNLTAVVTTDLTLTSGNAVKVAAVTPVVTGSTDSVAASAANITISGLAFDPAYGNNTVSFNDGAAGNVAAGNATSLTVTLSTAPTAAGSLTAVVTTDGTLTSGTAVQVATITPVVTSSAGNLSASAGNLTIHGQAFDTTYGNNTVVFNDGAVGTVTAGNATSLTVTFGNATGPSTAGNLTAIITTDGIGSGTAVQVATVTPVVTSSSGNLAANGGALTINGLGFDPAAGNNTVVFNDGAAGNVTAGNATSLDVVLSTAPTAAGNLTAVVTTNTQSSGNAVQVATVTPVVLANTANLLAADGNSVTITGFAFDATYGNNTVLFNDGAAGNVTAGNSTSLTVTLSSKPTTAGNLTAVVTTAGNLSSGAAVPVATVTPVVLTNTANLLAADATEVTIVGDGFDATAGNNTVSFNDGATVGNITSASATLLTVSFGNAPVTAGNLTAVVTTDGVSNGAAVSVATVTPVVTSSTGNLAANETTLIINGSGFDPVGTNTLVFSDGAAGNVTAATATSLTVTLSTQPTAPGNLTAVVTSAGQGSGAAVPVATVLPVVTSSAATLAANATTLTINGFGFDATPADNSVAFSDGAVGTVTGGNATSLTVTFSTRPTTAGSLTAAVTSDGVSSGAAVQVATVTPGVLSNGGYQLAANGNSVTINGYGFSTTPGNNTVDFNDGAAGNVTAASPTSLTVTFGTEPAAAGNLTALVTTNMLTSGVAVQVATVTPVVTSSAGNLAASATTLTINGSGFDTTAGNNTVSFNDGAAGNVTAANATSLTVELSTTPAVAGNLTAVVTTNGATSGAATQVATVIPVVAGNNAGLAANAGNITISGLGFDPTPSHNTVTFNDGAAGNVTAANATSLTVALSANPTAVGNLTASVTTDTQTSGAAVQVATVTPVVTGSTASLAGNANGVTINGFGFSTVLANNTVTFNDGAVGNVSSANSTSLTVTFGDAAMPTTAGSLTAVVTTNLLTSGAPVQVAAVTPVVTSSAGNLPANATTLTINGFGFDATAGNNTVVFNDGASGNVTAATPTSLTVTFGNTAKPTTAGNLTAVITTDGQSSAAALQVANVTPVVTASTGNLSASTGTLTIAGFGFDPTASHNTVLFNDGAAGNVTAANATSLSVTFSTRPTTAGSLTAVVTSDSESSGAAVQVSTVTPVVLPNAAYDLAANAATATIYGLGFDTTAVDNTVVFNDGAVGAVTAANTTSLTVTLSNAPTAAGNLTAVVTSDAVGSGAAVQVATVVPAVTGGTANLAANATTLTINGYGFGNAVGNDTVTFNDGAAGNVTAANATSLTVTFGNTTRPTTVGNLTALVTTNSLTSGAAVQVATVVPVVTGCTANLAANAGTLAINGAGFDATASHNTVIFNDGAVGTVTSGNATSLNVTFSVKPTGVGNLTALVTTDLLSSSAAVQVATVVPAVTGSTANLAANATSFTINGSGFDAAAGNNTVVFNDGAVGNVIAANATTLSGTFVTKPIVVGNLTAVVATDGVSSGAAVQIATVTPVVTGGTANLAANATQLTINGFDFNTTPGNNTVTFNDGAVGTVTAANTTSLTVTFGNATRPTTAGNLTAIVSTGGVSSRAAVQVATVVPVVTSSAANLAANATGLTINGAGFDLTAGNNTVTFNDGAVGTVTAGNATSLTVSFATRPVAAGNLTAVVTSDGVGSGTAVLAATVVPVVSTNTARLGANASTLTINGTGFSTTAVSNVVTFNNGAVGTVTSATATSLTVNITTKPTVVGSLTASVATNGVSSGTAVQVATVVPVVTSSTASLAANATTLTINGFGFSSTAASNTVSFNGATGSVTSASATSLTVTFSAKPSAVGALTAVVTTGTQNSGSAVQVATVIPAVTSSTASLAANAGSFTIAGFGFSTTPANNTIVFNDGAVGAVTTATANLLTVTLSTKPTTAGSLTAVVSANGVSSGAAVQVATVTPVVTGSAVSLAANATTVTIHGFGFDTTGVNNTVQFNDGAAGTVTSATATSLVVTFTGSGKPSTAGSLTAIVTTDGVNSGTAVQVATVTPVVTGSTTSLAANATSITITGYGFSSTGTNNQVAFNDGAVGVITAASATSLTVTLNPKPAAVGNLTAVVTTLGVSSGTAVQVATVVPVVTSVTANLAANANSLTISGFGFDATASRNTVLFNDGAVGTVTAASATSLTVTFSTKPPVAGSLTAVVTTDGVGSGTAVQVATIMPVVTSSTASLTSAGTMSVTINGYGFNGTTPSNNIVTFNNGATAGTVTSATTNSITVSLSAKPSPGALTAAVSSYGVSSGTPVQVATVIPAVSNTTTSLSHLTATTVTISGFGFSATPGNNTVLFNYGAVGTVTAASATSLTVTFSTKPTSAGSLTAVVTSSGMSSGSAVQVAQLS